MKLFLYFAINYEILDIMFPEFFLRTKILFLSKNRRFNKKIRETDYFIEFLFFTFFSLSLKSHRYIYIVSFERSAFMYVIDCLQCSWKKF